MRFLTLISILILLSCFSHKNSERAITIKVIGWNFIIPNETKFTDSVFNAKGELTDEIPIYGPSLKLFTINVHSSGVFSAYLRKDTLQYIDWKKYHDKDNELYFAEIKQLPKIKVLNSKYYTKTIDSIDFLVQFVKFIRKDKPDTGYTFHHYGRIKSFELDISFEYTDTLVGKKYLGIIQSSKFND